MVRCKITKKFNRVPVNDKLSRALNKLIPTYKECEKKQYLYIQILFNNRAIINY